MFLGLYLFCGKKVIAQFQNEKKMIGHQARLRENDDLPLVASSGHKEKAAIFNVRALVTREIMRSKDAQFNTTE